MERASKLKASRVYSSGAWLLLLLLLSEVLIGLVSGRLGGVIAVGIVGLLFVIAFIGFTVKRPYVFLLALIVAAFFVNYAQFMLRLPEFATWILPLMCGCFFLLIVFSRREEPRTSRSAFLRPVLVAMIVLIVVMALSAVANSTPAMVVLAGLKRYVPYLLVFFAIVILPPTRELQRTVLGLILGLVLIQVPMAILQRYGILPGAGVSTSLDDWAGGTLGTNATGILTMLCAGLAGVMLNLIVFDRVRFRYLAAAAFLMLAPVVSEGKAAILFVPAAVLTIVLLKIVYSRAGRWSSTFGVVALGVGLTFLVIYLMTVLGFGALMTQITGSRDALVRYLTIVGGDPQLARFGRLSELEAAMRFVAGNFKWFLVGLGPGVMSKTGQMGLTSAALVRDIGKGLGSAQASVMLIEFGWMGSTAFLVLHLTVLNGIIKASRKAVSPTVEYATSFVVVWVVFMLGIGYTQPWLSAPLSMSFWVFAGIVWTNTAGSGSAA